MILWISLGFPLFRALNYSIVIVCDRMKCANWFSADVFHHSIVYSPLLFPHLAPVHTSRVYLLNSKFIFLRWNFRFWKYINRFVLVSAHLSASHLIYLNFWWFFEMASFTCRYTTRNNFSTVLFIFLLYFSTEKLLRHHCWKLNCVDRHITMGCNGENGTEIMCTTASRPSIVLDQQQKDENISLCKKWNKNHLDFLESIAMRSSSSLFFSVFSISSSYFVLATKQLWVIACSSWACERSENAKTLENIKHFQRVTEKAWIQRQNAFYIWERWTFRWHIYTKTKCIFGFRNKSTTMQINRSTRIMAKSGFARAQNSTKRRIFFVVEETDALSSNVIRRHGWLSYK